ncbi:glycosyl hydrolase family 47 [Phlyctema vagabunda]|uniref:alpha-1,2-Mannosidase n=1 Tax=Phlyctema vagabunda TaxID=108571 RepID=A0ABR4PBU9_9HELO
MNRHILLLSSAAFALTTALHGPSIHELAEIQEKRDNADYSSLNEERADAVKEAFTFSWNGYEKYAFPNDELLPLTNNFSNSRNAWGASAVDALSTALVMQIPDIVDTIVNYIPTINYDNTSTQVSLFETTIRYLGYDLLKGPLSHLASNETNVDALLSQSVRLADNLAFAFDTSTGIPINNLYFDPPSTDNSTTNGLATVGTLVMEWVHLSDLTGDPTYGALAEKGESYLLDPKPASSEPWPGLVGSEVDVNTGLFTDAVGGWVGGTDSFYEYLIKMYAYDTTRYASYKDRWILAADSSIAQLASNPSTRPDLTFLAMYNGTQLIYESEHLACFDGGNFIFGGLILHEQKYIDFGLELVNGCHDTYTSTLTGIGPEVFNWVTNTTAANDTVNPQPPANQTAFYEKAGFYITNSNYVLRPEVIESFYYAYRATGDQVYREWAWNAFVAINATCRAGSGFAGLKDVNADPPGLRNFQESFWFAEVLKYSYLIHSEDAVWQVEHNGVNEFVFNTEAHPFKVAGTPI